MRAWLRQLFYGMLPGTCALCDAPSLRTLDLCQGCEDDLPRLGAACIRCALPLPEAPGVEAVCGRCLARPPPFSRTLAPFRYAFPVDRMLTRFKFERSLLYGELLAQALAVQIAAGYGCRPPDLVLPVPLHPRRLRARGFNQAALIARTLAREVPLELRCDLAVRVRDTPAQSALSARARRANLRAAFAIRANVEGRSVAIVDDVMTTGTTVSALARALLAQGAAEVHVWALARSIQQR